LINQIPELNKQMQAMKAAIKAWSELLQQQHQTNTQYLFKKEKRIQQHLTNIKDFLCNVSAQIESYYSQSMAMTTKNQSETSFISKINNSESTNNKNVNSSQTKESTNNNESKNNK
jgi:hypothetical protein